MEQFRGLAIGVLLEMLCAPSPNRENVLKAIEKGASFRASQRADSGENKKSTKKPKANAGILQAIFKSEPKKPEANPDNIKIAEDIYQRQCENDDLTKRFAAMALRNLSLDGAYPTVPKKECTVATCLITHLQMPS